MHIDIFNLFVNLCKFLSKNGATIYTHNAPPRPKNSEHSRQIRPIRVKLRLNPLVNVKRGRPECRFRKRASSFRNKTDMVEMVGVMRGTGSPTKLHLHCAAPMRTAGRVPPLGRPHPRPGQGVSCPALPHHDQAGC